MEFGIDKKELTPTLITVNAQKMADLKTLKRARAVARGWVTRSVKTIQALDEKAADRVDVEEAIADFDARLVTLDEAQRAVEMELPDADLDADLDDAGIFRDKAKTARKKASRLLLKLSPVIENESTVSENGQQAVKLPKLELPKFSGDIIEWQTFWDKFKATVDSLELPVITKFTYLQSLLVGEADASISGLTLTSANYTIACKVLEERFGKKEQIIFAHIQALLNMSMPTVGSRMQNLRSFQDKLLSHVRCLETMDVKGDTYGIFLTPVILSRLPNDIRMEWAREGAGKESDLEWLLSFLKNKTERRQRADVFSTSEVVKQTANSITSKRPDRRDEEKRRKPQKATASALKNTSEVDQSCGFCNNGHPSKTCRKLLSNDISVRQNMIKDAGLCFRCLEKGHIVKGCASKCSKCNGRHHYVCCYQMSKSDNYTGDNSANPMNTTPKQLDMSRVGVAGSDKISSKCSILQTASVYVCLQGRETKATLLFDSGADRSYVSIH